MVRRHTSEYEIFRKQLELQRVIMEVVFREWQYKLYSNMRYYYLMRKGAG